VQANINPIQLPAEKNTLVLQEKNWQSKKKKKKKKKFNSSVHFHSCNLKSLLHDKNYSRRTKPCSDE